MDNVRHADDTPRNRLHPTPLDRIIHEDGAREVAQAWWLIPVGELCVHVGHLATQMQKVSDTMSDTHYKERKDAAREKPGSRQFGAVLDVL